MSFATPHTILFSGLLWFCCTSVWQKHMPCYGIVWLKPLHMSIYTRNDTLGVFRPLSNLDGIAIQSSVALDTELAVCASGHVRYRRARRPSRRPLVEFLQPARGEVLCSVNPSSSNSVPHACHPRHMLLSAWFLSPPETNGGLDCGLIHTAFSVVPASQALSTLNDIIFNLLLASPIESTNFGASV